MRVRAQVALVLVACAGLVAVAGCSSDESSDEVSDLEQYPPSQLGALLGLGDQAETQVANALQARTNAEELVRCMRSRGFDDFPMPRVPEPIEVPQALADRQELGELGFAELHGFGITTIAPETFRSGGGDDTIVDYARSLDQETRDAFYENMGVGEDSCERRALDATASLPEVEAVRLYGEASSEIDDRVRADPRIVEANGDYAACMAEAGFDAASPDDAATQANEAFVRFLSETAIGGSSEPDASFVDQLGADSRAELDRLREQEIDLAVQSLMCEADSRSIRIEVAVEAESAWIAENGDRLLLED